MIEVREKILGLQRSSGRVAVLGAGAVGTALAKALTEWKIAVSLFEQQPRDSYLAASPFGKCAEQLESRGVSLHFESKELLSEDLAGYSLVLPSPGVSQNRGLLKQFIDADVPVLSEFDLCYGLVSSVPIVMITGSNGKSTTTALIGHLLSALGLDVMVGGNIGVPFMELVASLLDDSLGELHLPDVFVIEASSYQLEQSVSFVPHVGVFLNLSENHLERHGTLANYFAAKASPFLRQSAKNFAILNSHDIWCQQLVTDTKAEVLLFGDGEGTAAHRLDARVTYQPDRALDWIDLSKSTRIELNGVTLPGRHNRDNIAAALLAVRCFGFDPIIIREALLSFEGLPHRMQIVSARQPVTWINDSKSTTVTSSLVALEAVVESCPKKPIILLLGGLLKSGSQWEPLFKVMASLKDRLRVVILFGAGASELSRYARDEDLMNISTTSVAEAVQRAYALARPGDVVLFSPGAASFDEFRDFEHRGVYFSQLVKEQGPGDAAE